MGDQNKTIPVDCMTKGAVAAMAWEMEQVCRENGTDGPEAKSAIDKVILEAHQAFTTTKPTQVDSWVEEMASKLGKF